MAGLGTAFPCVPTTGVGSGGYARDLTPQLFMWGMLIEFNVQIDISCTPFSGWVYSRTQLGELTALPQTPWLVRTGWLLPPEEPHRPLSALRASPRLSYYIYSKISSHPP